MSTLGLPTSGPTALTPCGLKGGGATTLFLACDDIQRGMRRARWKSPTTAEIYLQDVFAFEFVASLFDL